MHHSELLITAWIDLIFLCSWPFIKLKIKGFVFARYSSCRVMNDAVLSFMIWLVDSRTCFAGTNLLQSRWKSKVMTARHPVLQYFRPEGQEVGEKETCCTGLLLFPEAELESWGLECLLHPFFPLIDLEQHCHPVARMQYCYQKMSSLWFVSATVAWQQTGVLKPSQPREHHYIAEHFAFWRVNNISDIWRCIS